MYINNINGFNLFAGPYDLTVNITENIMDLSVVVQWDAVDDLLPTNFVVTLIGDETYSIQSPTLIEQSSYTITGLTIDTVYTITVTASNTCGTGQEHRANVSFRTGIILTICDWAWGNYLICTRTEIYLIDV